MLPFCATVLLRSCEFARCCEHMPTGTEMGIAVQLLCDLHTSVDMRGAGSTEIDSKTFMMVLY
jgi:hypothetical protein